MIWGAGAAIVAAIIVYMATATGSALPDNALLDHPLKAAGGAFIWGAGVAMLRNWLARRR